LITAYTVKENYEHATRLETVVFLHLRRTQKEIYYYKTKNGKEVDFLIISPNNTIGLYQVCYNLVDEKTFEREASALQQAMAETAVTSGTIITLNDERQIKTLDGTIVCLPLWKFLLKDE
jgi:uncharacterized protein